MLWILIIRTHIKNESSHMRGLIDYNVNVPDATHIKKGNFLLVCYVKNITLRLRELVKYYE